MTVLLVSGGIVAGLIAAYLLVKIGIRELFR